MQIYHRYTYTREESLTLQRTEVGSLSLCVPVVTAAAPYLSAAAAPYFSLSPLPMLDAPCLPAAAAAPCLPPPLAYATAACRVAAGNHSAAASAAKNGRQRDKGEM
jgi:hypothetical protein